MNSRTCIVFAAVLLVAVAGGASASGVRGASSIDRRLATMYKPCTTFEQIAMPSSFCLFKQGCVTTQLIANGLQSDANDLQRKVQADTDRIHETMRLGRQRMGKTAYDKAFKNHRVPATTVVRTPGQPRNIDEALVDRKNNLVKYRQTEQKYKTLRDNSGARACRKLMPVIGTTERVLTEVYNIVKCPIVKTVVQQVVKREEKAIKAELCAEWDAEIVAACEVAGGGPEEPASDVCAAVLTATFSTACKAFIDKTGSLLQAHVIKAAGC